MGFATLFRRLAPAALAVAVFAAPASAQDGPPQPDPRPIVEECLEAMRQTTVRTCVAIRNTTEAGIMRMARLAHEGAPDGAIIETARETLERIGLIADEGRDQVRRISAHCLRRLHEIGAPRPFLDKVREGRDKSIGQINECARQARTTVRRALAHFLGVENPSGVGAG